LFISSNDDSHLLPLVVIGLRHADNSASPAFPLFTKRLPHGWSEDAMSALSD
jgi:hypothetical protein